MDNGGTQFDISIYSDASCFSSEKCEKIKNLLKWEYSESANCWTASRLMPDGVCNFVYKIFPMMGGGYIAEASNNAYGACRVAVENASCTEYSIFDDINDLMTRIENRSIYWLYTSHCNCIGKVTKEEY